MEDNTAQLREITRQLDQNNKDRDTLLTLRMHGEIEADTFARKDGELRNLSKRLKPAEAIPPEDGGLNRAL